MRAVEAAHERWTRACDEMERGRRRKAKIREALEDSELSSRMAFLMARDIDMVASRFIGIMDRTDKIPRTPPYYLVDHIETKADAPLRVVVGALLATEHSTADIVRVISAARSSRVDGAQIRRLAAALRRVEAVRPDKSPTLR